MSSRTRGTPLLATTVAGHTKKQHHNHNHNHDNDNNNDNVNVNDNDNDNDNDSAEGRSASGVPASPHHATPGRGFGWELMNLAENPRLE